MLTKRYQKRDILIVFKGVSLLTVLGALFAVKTESIILFMLAIFLRNTIQPIETGITTGLGGDIQNYHHWKYGERSDSLSGVFSWFLNPVNMGIGYIVPWLLELTGYTSDWDVLYDSQILNNVFNIYTWCTIAGIVMFTIPYFFYDLTKEKHDMCVRELQERLKRSEEADKEEVSAV